MVTNYIPLGALIVSVLGFLVLVVKSTSNKDLIISIKDSNKEMIAGLKESIKELREALAEHTKIQRDNFFDFREHQNQSNRTHNEVHELSKKFDDLIIEVSSYHGKVQLMEKAILDIKNNTLECRKTKN